MFPVIRRKYTPSQADFDWSNYLSIFMRNANDPASRATINIIHDYVAHSESDSASICFEYVLMTIRDTGWLSYTFHTLTEKVKIWKLLKYLPNYMLRWKVCTNSTFIAYRLHQNNDYLDFILCSFSFCWSFVVIWRHVTLCWVRLSLRLLTSYASPR